MRKIWLALVFALLAMPAFAQNMAPANDQDLANKLSNPISDLISVPFQFNWDCCYGPSDGGRFTLNIQPVVPIRLNPDWTLIVRTILPLINQEETAPGLGDHFGLGDTIQSFFFSPNPRPGGIIWGAGPAFLWPTATDNTLGSRKWGIGPTFVVLKQQAGWTIGLLANHIWSYAGETDHPYVSRTFLQPFIGYTWPDTTGLTLNTESTYDWHTDQWTVPLNLTLSHLFKFGMQRVSLQVGGRYYPVTPSDGPRWGARFAIVLLFPK